MSERLDEIARLRERLRELHADGQPETVERVAAYTDRFRWLGTSPVVVERLLVYEGPADEVAKWLGRSLPVGEAHGPLAPLRLTIYEAEPEQVGTFEDAP